MHVIRFPLPLSSDRRQPLSASSVYYIFARHLLGFLVQSEDNIGRRTNNLDGCHSIQTNWCPHACHPHIFMVDALPDTALPIYPGLGQAPSMLACIPSGLVLLTT